MMAMHIQLEGANLPPNDQGIDMEEASPQSLTSPVQYFADMELREALIAMVHTKSVTSEGCSLILGL